MKARLDQLRRELSTQVLGADDPAFLLTAALLAGGHTLVQGAPGVGKTSLAKALANLVGGSFGRIQFTPDLLPADILGYSVFNQADQSFEFVPGPVFNHLVLADEINRTSPRIQSALLESMNEGQVSIDGRTRPLPRPFMVIATQNNRYAAGTFPLPVPQLDRFLISLEMRLPGRSMQTAILRMHANGGVPQRDEPLFDQKDVVALQDEVRHLPVSDAVCDYMVRLCEALRVDRQLQNDISARASIALMRASQAAAFLEGHEAVYPDDVKRVAVPVLAHRLAPASEERDEAARRRKVGETVERVLAEVVVP